MMSNFQWSKEDSELTHGSSLSHCHPSPIITTASNESWEGRGVGLGEKGRGWGWEQGYWDGVMYM